MATKARKSAKKKTVRTAKKRIVARKTRARKAPARKQSKVARVKRVTQKVVQQASDAMSAGVETLRDLGGNLVDRVRNGG